MIKSDLPNATSTNALTAFTTWLKNRWGAYFFANENPFEIVRAETIESTDGSSYMRWAVVTRR